LAIGRRVDSCARTRRAIGRWLRGLVRWVPWSALEGEGEGEGLVGSHWSSLPQPVRAGGWL